MSRNGVSDTCNHSNELLYNDWLRRELDLDIRETSAWIPRREGLLLQLKTTLNS